MERNRSIRNATAIPVLMYPDVRAAVGWLTEAFGFAERLQIGEDHRSQMNVGEGGAVIIGDLRFERVPPRAGEVTHSVLMRVEDASAYCEHARAHGAKILDEPTDHMYDERQYNAEDPWGHQWSFSQTLADVDPADWSGILRE
ncbi:MAG: VOC family protein [Solirubrobacteraceae bacterium]